ncbi:MAG: hypothetical protein GXC72_13510 [Chitinophagaceae bacterium]|nr:hypothetical protein [Chitinophagaceae bacterium]
MPEIKSNFQYSIKKGTKNRQKSITKSLLGLIHLFVENTDYQKKIVSTAMLPPLADKPCPSFLPYGREDTNTDRYGLLLAARTTRFLLLLVSIFIFSIMLLSDQSLLNKGIISAMLQA